MDQMDQLHLPPDIFRQMTESRVLLWRGWLRRVKAYAARCTQACFPEKYRRMRDVG
jgi:hypothetical protein